MTAKRDLKRRVRERQLQTGESYMTALRHVRSKRPHAVPVVEMIDVTEVAAALGLQIRTMLSPILADRIDVAGALHRLRAALAATGRDPAFAVMRAAVLRGEHPFAAQATDAANRRYLGRVRAGVGGISEDGRMLALAVSGRRGLEMVLFLLRLHVRYVKQAPGLFVTSLDGVTTVAPGAMLAWR